MKVLFLQTRQVDPTWWQMLKAILQVDTCITQWLALTRFLQVDGSEYLKDSYKYKHMYRYYYSKP